MTIKTPQDLIAEAINAIEDDLQSAQDNLQRAIHMGASVDVADDDRKKLRLLADKTSTVIDRAAKVTARLHSELERCATENNLDIRSAAGPGRKVPD